MSEKDFWGLAAVTAMVVGLILAFIALSWGAYRFGYWLGTA